MSPELSGRSGVQGEGRPRYSTEVRLWLLQRGNLNSLGICEKLASLISRDTIFCLLVNWDFFVLFFFMVRQF